MAATLAEQAATAYLDGWARAGGPLTEATASGCHAAVLAALEHPGPGVLEVALDLGALQGAWAKVYQRREDLIADHTAKIMRLWRKAAKRIDWASLVRTFRQQAGLTREATTPHAQLTAVLRAEAAALAAGLLAGIADGPLYDALVAAIETALAAAEAEGATAALAVAAEEAGAEGFDWDLAYAHMYEPLAQAMEELPGMGAEWVQRIIAGNAADIGRTLASLAANGGTYEEMVSAVQDLATGTSIRAVTALIDYAMSGSAAQGALNLYRSEGVPAVDWLTAGDGAVCPICQGYEDGNPYPPEDFPGCPAHPFCRCTPAVSATYLSSALWAPFLQTAA